MGDRSFTWALLANKGGLNIPVLGLNTKTQNPEFKNPYCNQIVMIEKQTPYAKKDFEPLNEARKARLHAQFISHSIALVEIKEHIGPQKAQTLPKENLLSKEINGITWYPLWQFDGESETGIREDLAQLRETVARYTKDAVFIDSIMHRHYEELGGRNLLEALPDTSAREQVFFILKTLGDGF